ncbi:ras association domain-containing protein 4-like [Artemia franciscana]|uniref:Ras association domain-containing protein 2 n=1 Tax=Artemia franciscana TaxID=6661 RepID=A0AA88LCG0_ARTSF|nr:hypothetical protein QYM36_000654 [Artemia franciscana]
MWTCQACGKAVYFAERKQSIGFDWHPKCLQCAECRKILTPGQHAEHKGLPFCHIPCYAALFGPQLFGHGTRVESHSSFGKGEGKTYGGVSRSELESKLKIYNKFFEKKNGGLKSREVNGRMVLEGVLKVYWGVQHTIYLKEQDDQRLPKAVQRKTYRRAVSAALDVDPADYWYFQNSDSDNEPDQSSTPSTKSFEDSNNSNSISTESSLFSPKSRKSLSSSSDIPSEPSSPLTPSSSTPLTERRLSNGQSRGSTAIRRQHGRRFDKSKLKRRCSINGHYYNRDTSVFTPPHGSVMSVWITSLVSSQEVMNMVLEKYKIESQSSSFALYLIRENGEARKLRDDENPLILRVLLGPNEDVAKLYLMDSTATTEISSAVAQYLNLSQVECRSILAKFAEEEEKEIEQTRLRYAELRRRMELRLQQLKVKL